MDDTNLEEEDTSAKEDEAKTGDGPTNTELAARWMQQIQTAHQMSMQAAMKPETKGQEDLMTNLLQFSHLTGQHGLLPTHPFLQGHLELQQRIFAEHILRNLGGMQEQDKLTQNANRTSIPPPLMAGVPHPFGPRMLLPSPPRGTRMPPTSRVDSFQPPFSPLMMRPMMAGNPGLAAKAAQSSQMQSKTPLLATPEPENFRCIWCQDRFLTLSELADHLKEAKHGDVMTAQPPSTAAGFRPVTSTALAKMDIPPPFSGNNVTAKKSSKRAFTPGAQQSSKNNSGE